MKIVICFIALFLCYAIAAFCQTESPSKPDTESSKPDTDTESEGRIENAVSNFREAHRHLVGIFRLQPRIAFHAGLDANSGFGDEDADVDPRLRQEDFFFSVVPGISAGVKFGSRAFLQVLENLNFVYYLNREERRDIFNSTAARFVTGTSNFLLTVDGRYERRNAPLDEELDEPVEHVISTTGITGEYSLTSRIEMRHNVRFRRRTFEKTEEILNSSLTLTDRNDWSFGTGVTYKLKETLGLTLDGTIRHSKALDTDLHSDTWEVLTGVAIEQTRMRGHFAVGFGQTDNDNNQRRNNLLLNGDFNFLLRKVTIGLFISRRYAFSVLADDVTRLTTQGGIRFSSPIAGRFGLTGSYILGQNDYDDSLIAGTVINSDTFHRADLGLDIRLVEHLSVRPGVFYFKRDSGIPELDKEAFGYFITLGVGYVLEF
jgi:hypothetical protein